MKTNGFLAILCLLAATTPAAAAPAETGPVELKGDVKVERILSENGRQQRVLAEPKVVVPGDRLVFATSYHNASATLVKDFIVTNPVPAGVMLAPDSAGMLDVSVDGGKTWGKLAALTVADGAGGRRAAQAGDVTHLRWTLSTLAPGAKGTLTYNAIVR